MALGKHRIEYEALEGWERLPEGWSFVEVAGVACDSRDRVYVFNRGAHPVIVFDKEGRFLNAWGEGMFKGPHGIFIDDQDRLHIAEGGFLNYNAARLPEIPPPLGMRLKEVTKWRDDEAPLTSHCSCFPTRLE